MNKRFLAVMLIVAMMIPMAAMPASAAEPRSSDYLDSCYANLTKGSGSGRLTLDFAVSSSVKGITKIGVSKIVIYRQNGSVYATLFGSTDNGLLETSGTYMDGTYTIRGMMPNTYYYCDVTFIVADAYGSDTYTITTSSVKTPA